MERWSGRVALVTGASAGIGEAIAKELVLHGMTVIGVARKVERVKALQAELKGANGKLYPIAGDITKEADILRVFEWATKNLGGVDVLINNAGLGGRAAHFTNSSSENWRSMLDINVLGLSICTREAIKSMQARGINDGHIIQVGRYSATKFAVRALTEALRKELIALNSRIKTTSLSPGLVRTEFASGDKNNPDLSFFEDRPYLEAKTLADSIIYILGTPENVQISELLVIPVGQRT